MPPKNVPPDNRLKITGNRLYVIGMLIFHDKMSRDFEIEQLLATLAHFEIHTKSKANIRPKVT